MTSTADPTNAEVQLQALENGTRQNAGIYAALGTELSQIWNDKECSNEPLERGECVQDGKHIIDMQIRIPTSTDQMPMTRKMVGAVLAARAEEKGVSISELTVVVAFHGVNTMEVLPWLEAGAKVIAVDTKYLAKRRLRKQLRQYDAELRQNFKAVTAHLWNTPKGDIVAACHPSKHKIRRPIRKVIDAFRGREGRVTCYGKKDAIYVIQSAYPGVIDRFYTKAKYQMIFNADRTDTAVGLYLFPSHFLRPGSSEIVFATPIRK